MVVTVRRRLPTEQLTVVPTLRYASLVDGGCTHSACFSSSNTPLAPPPPFRAMFSLSADDAAMARSSYSLIWGGLSTLSLNTTRRKGGGAEPAQRPRGAPCWTSR